MSKVVDYLNAVDSDARMAAGFENNPEESMREFGLLAQDICALISGGGDAVIAKSLGMQEEFGIIQVNQKLHKTFDDEVVNDWTS